MHKHASTQLTCPLATCALPLATGGLCANALINPGRPPFFAYTARLQLRPEAFQLVRVPCRRGLREGRVALQLNGLHTARVRGALGGPGLGARVGLCL